MKKIFLLLPLLAFLISCEKEQLSNTSDFDYNEDIEHINSRNDLDIDPDPDPDEGEPCVEIDTLGNNEEGCCVYEICLPKNFDLQIIDGETTFTPSTTGLTPCIRIVVCDSATIRIIETVKIDPFDPGVSYIRCEFELTCGVDLGCPLVAEFYNVFPEDHPNYGCCVYTYEITQDPPPGCEWILETGPNGNVSPWGLARICPGETLDLKLDCGDGDVQEVCSLDLECEGTSTDPCEEACDDICFRFESLLAPNIDGCFEYAIEVFGDTECLGINAMENALINKVCTTEQISTSSNRAVYETCNCSKEEFSLHIIIETAECGIFEIGPYNTFEGLEGNECP